MKPKAWACMWAAVLVSASTAAWAADEGNVDEETIVVLEPEDIEEIKEDALEASRDALEIVREALEEARKEMRESGRDERDHNRARREVRIQVDDRDEIREAVREVVRESQDALREAGDSIHELFAQNMPAFHNSIGPMLVPSFTLSDAGAGNAKPVDETKPATGVTDIGIHNVSGKIVIVGWDQDTINVKGSLGEDVEELIFSVDGSSSEIRVKVPERHRNLKILSNLTISVPKRLRVNSQTVSGGVEASGIDGSRVSLESVSGGIVVKACSGDIDAHTTSGGIEIHDAKKEVDAECVSGGIEIYGAPTIVSAETVSGGVTVEGAQQEVSAESVSGRVNVIAGKLSRFNAGSISGGIEYEGGMAPGARFELNTLSGGIRLRFTEDVSAEFELHSFSGGIEVDLPGAPTSGKKELEFTTGNGDATVDAEAFSGGIRVGKK